MYEPVRLGDPLTTRAWGLELRFETEELDFPGVAIDCKNGAHRPDDRSPANRKPGAVAAQVMCAEAHIREKRVVRHVENMGAVHLPLADYSPGQHVW
jgi:hypothetical protein